MARRHESRRFGPDKVIETVRWKVWPLGDYLWQVSVNTMSEGSYAVSGETWKTELRPTVLHDSGALSVANAVNKPTPTGSWADRFKNWDRAEEIVAAVEALLV